MVTAAGGMRGGSGSLAFVRARDGEPRKRLQGQQAGPPVEMATDSRPVALLVEGLVKRYGSVVAVAGISFTVWQGEIFGLLGPNGAGKTTTLEILEGLRRPDEGRAVVAGVDATRHPRRVREVIGVQLQEAGFFDRLTVLETARLFASFHRRAVPVQALLESLHLGEKLHAPVETLSGGQRQRLAIALALLNDPKVVFLDEPTTGLDPQARRNLWDVIARIRDEGRTVVLTTHYMDEAQQLCDRVGIIDHGRLIALDTPRNLIRQYAPGARIHVQLPAGQEAALPEPLPGVRRIERVEGGEAGHVGLVLHTEQPSETLSGLFARVQEGALTLVGLRVEEPNLEDVFLHLTGHHLRE